MVTSYKFLGVLMNTSAGLIKEYLVASCLILSYIAVSTKTNKTENHEQITYTHLSVMIKVGSKVNK